MISAVQSLENRLEKYKINITLQSANMIGAELDTIGSTGVGTGVGMVCGLLFMALMNFHLQFPEKSTLRCASVTVN